VGLRAVLFASDGATGNEHTVGRPRGTDTLG
jgi:hypothetical protein